MLCPDVTRVLGDGTVLIPFRFVLWIGCCIVSLSPEIARYPLHMYLVGPDRLGAALDAVLPHVAGAARMHCTLLRLRVMRVGASLRSQAGGVPPALLVMDADLLVLSDYDEAPLMPPPPARVSIEDFAADAQGRHDFERACAVALTAARAAPLVATPLPFSPPATEFLELGGMSGQDGTMLPLSLLELAWWPRFGHAGIRGGNSGFAAFFAAVRRAMPDDETTVLAGLSPEELATEVSRWTCTLLPEPDEFAAYYATRPEVRLAVSRIFALARSSSGAAVVTLHNAAPMLVHFPALALAVGVDFDAAGTAGSLGLLSELVRAATGSTSASMTLGLVSATAHAMEYLMPKLRDAVVAGRGAVDRTALVVRELRTRAELKTAARSSGASGGASGGDAGASPPDDAARRVAGGASLGYSQLYSDAYIEVIADAEFCRFAALVTAQIGDGTPPRDTILAIMAYRGVGHMVFLHALQGRKSAARDCPVIALVYTRLRPHGPATMSHVIAEQALAAESADLPRPTPPPNHDLWGGWCAGSLTSCDLHRALALVEGTCNGQSPIHFLAAGEQFKTIEAVRRFESVFVPCFEAWGHSLGGPRSIDTVLSTMIDYYEKATARSPAARGLVMQSAMDGMARETATLNASLLGSGDPCAVANDDFVVAHSAALADLNRSRQDLPMENALARVMSTMLGADTALANGIGSAYWPAGMAPPSAAPAPAARAGKPEPTPQVVGDLPAPKAGAPGQDPGADGGVGADTYAVGSNWKSHVDCRVAGVLRIGRRGKMKTCQLKDFYEAEGVPKPNAGSLPDPRRPGKKCCPAVWLSTREHPEVNCPCVDEEGKPRLGHESATSSAHRPPAGWRSKYVPLLLLASAAQGSTMRVPRAAPRSPMTVPRSLQSIGAALGGAGAAWAPDAPVLEPRTWDAPELVPAGLSLAALVTPTLDAAGEPPSYWTDLPSPSDSEARGATSVSSSATHAGARAETAPTAPPLSPSLPMPLPPPTRSVEVFCESGGHVYLPIWFPRDDEPCVALPTTPRSHCFGTDEESLRARSDGRREAALEEAWKWTHALFPRRSDLVPFGFYADSTSAGGEVTGFVVSDPPPPGAECVAQDSPPDTAEATLRWVRVTTITQPQLRRLAVIAVARARSFSRPGPDVTAMGVRLGSMGPTPVVPLSEYSLSHTACRPMSLEELKRRCDDDLLALRNALTDAIDGGAHSAYVTEHLRGWRGCIAPPNWGDISAGTLAQAAVPCDARIAGVPFPGFCRLVQSLPMPPRAQPPPYFCVPGGCTEWHHCFHSAANECIFEFLFALRDCMRRLAKGVEPAAVVLRDMPESVAVGIDMVAPWLAALARQGHVLVKRDGKFALLDCSQPIQTHLNLPYWRAMFDENDSRDYALHDMAITHGASYMADVEPQLLLQGPLHSFSASHVGFMSAHSDVAKMEKRGWFEFYAMERLDEGVFDLPSFPWRTNSSGCVPRKLEPDRWRSIQDFGSPRRLLLTLSIAAAIEWLRRHGRRSRPKRPFTVAPWVGHSADGTAVDAVETDAAARKVRRRAAHHAAAPRTRRMLHLFCGATAVLAAAAEAQGWTVVSSGLEADGSDFGDAEVRGRMLARIASGEFDGVLIAVPSTIFGASIGGDGEARCLLRTRAAPDGAAGLPAWRASQLAAENTILAFCARAARSQLDQGGELIVECAASRSDAASPAFEAALARLPSAWESAPLISVKRHAAARGRPLCSYIAPHCAFGSAAGGRRLLKWTRFLATPLAAARMGALAGRTCSCTSGTHVARSTRSRRGRGTLEPAAPYPAELATVVASALAASDQTAAEVCCPTTPDMTTTAGRQPVVPLNVATGVHASKALRAALRSPAAAAHLRYTPALRRRLEEPGQHDSFVAGLVEPTPAYATPSWAGGRWSWPPELKAFFSDLLVTLCIICYGANLCGCPVFVNTNDCHSWFHQWVLSTVTMAQAGMFRLDPTALDRGDIDAALIAVEARCLEMGVSPSSNWCQRLLGEMQCAESRRFGKAEEPHLRVLERKFPKFGKFRESRRALGRTTGRDEARMHACLGYTDDLCNVVMGAAGMVRFLVMHTLHLGPDGLNVLMAIAEKRHLGVSVPFLGAHALVVGLLAYVPPAKVHRTTCDIESALNGTMTVADYVKLVGMLNHLVMVLMIPYHQMYGLYAALDEARRAGLGQDAVVPMVPPAEEALQRWLKALRLRSGNTALASIFNVLRPVASEIVHVLHSDACVLGAGEPAIAGNLYAHIFILPLTQEHLELPIVALEFLGGIFNVLLFGAMCVGLTTLLVLDALVVPTVMAGKASSPIMQYLHALLLGLEEYRILAPTLFVSHENGPYNPIADAASRTKTAELNALMQHMGLKAQMVNVTPQMEKIMSDTVAMWRSMGAPARAEAAAESEALLAARAERRAARGGHRPPSRSTLLATTLLAMAAPTQGRDTTAAARGGDSLARSMTPVEMQLGLSYLNSASSGLSPFSGSSGDCESLGPLRTARLEADKMLARFEAAAAAAAGANQDAHKLSEEANRSSSNLKPTDEKMASIDKSVLAHDVFASGSSPPDVFASGATAANATDAPHLTANAAAPHPVPLHPGQLPQQECAGDLPRAAAASEGFDVESIVEPNNQQFIDSNCGIRDCGEIVATALVPPRLSATWHVESTDAELEVTILDGVACTGRTKRSACKAVVGTSGRGEAVLGPGRRCLAAGTSSRDRLAAGALAIAAQVHAASPSLPLEPPEEALALGALHVAPSTSHVAPSTSHVWLSDASVTLAAASTSTPHCGFLGKVALAAAVANERLGAEGGELATAILLDGVSPNPRPPLPSAALAHVEPRVEMTRAPSAPPRRAGPRRPLCDCDGCRATPCGDCANCRDKPRFGGPGTRRQRCSELVCLREEAPRVSSAPPSPPSAGQSGYDGGSCDDLPNLVIEMLAFQQPRLDEIGPSPPRPARTWKSQVTPREAWRASPDGLSVVCLPPVSKNDPHARGRVSRAPTSLEGFVLGARRAARGLADTLARVGRASRAVWLRLRSRCRYVRATRTPFSAALPLVVAGAARSISVATAAARVSPPASPPRAAPPSPVRRARSLPPAVVTAPFRALRAASAPVLPTRCLARPCPLDVTPLRLDFQGGVQRRTRPPPLPVCAGRAAAHNLEAVACNRTPRVGPVALPTAARWRPSSAFPPPAASAASERFAPSTRNVAARIPVLATAVRRVEGGDVAGASRRARGLAILPNNPEELQEQQRRVFGVIEQGFAPSTSAADKGHFECWAEFCRSMGTSPWRTDAAANSGLDQEGHREEVLLMCMALIHLYSRMKPRKRSDPAPDPRSALKKLQAVRRVHRTRMISMVSLDLVLLAVKGMMRIYIAEHGVQSLVPDRKLPLNNALIDGMLSTPDGAERAGLVVCRAAYYWVAMLALFATLGESGERKDEVSGDKGRNGFTFASLTWKIGGRMLNPDEITPDALAQMCEGDGVLLAHGIAKNDPVGAFFAATPSFLAWRRTGRCACRRLAELEVLAAVPVTERLATPLFGPARGQFFTAGQVDAAFLLLLICGNSAMTEEIARSYSVHSFRIFLACALLAAGAQRWLIKRMLRWRGDESLEIYARVNDDDWADWGGQALHSRVDSSIVPRLPNLDVSQEQQKAFLGLADALLGLSASAARSSADM